MRQQLDSFNEFIQHTMQEIVGTWARDAARRRAPRDYIYAALIFKFETVI